MGGGERVCLEVVAIGRVIGRKDMMYIGVDRHRGGEGLAGIGEGWGWQASGRGGVGGHRGGVGLAGIGEGGVGRGGVGRHRGGEGLAGIGEGRGWWTLGRGGLADIGEGRVGRYWGGRE